MYEGIIKLQNKRKNHEKKLSWIGYILPISFVFSAYQFYGFSLMYILLLVTTILIILLNKKVYYIQKYFLYFIIFVLMHEVLAIPFLKDFDSITVLKTILESILTVIFVVVISSVLDYNDFYKKYRLIVYIAMIGLFYHATLVYIFNQPVVPIRIFGGLLGDTSQWTNYIYRPMSFFIEPEAYSTFLIPFIIMSLHKNKILVATLASFSILLSTSSLGFVILILIWILWFLFNRRSNKKIFLVLFILITPIVLILSITGILEYNIMKLFSEDIFVNTRLTQGLNIYGQMPIFDQITGIGRRNIALYILDNGITLPSMINIDNVTKWTYFTTAYGVFIYYGIIGGLLYFLMLIKNVILYNKSYLILTLSFSLIAMSFGRTVIFNATFILWFSIIYIAIMNVSSIKYFKISKNIVRFV